MAKELLQRQICKSCGALQASAAQLLSCNRCLTYVMVAIGCGEPWATRPRVLPVPARHPLRRLEARSLQMQEPMPQVQRQGNASILAMRGAAVLQHILVLRLWPSIAACASKKCLPGTTCER